ncbi:PNK3P-domain-containing protein [Phlegmacium glaucopus]|nr:PNK3P-domain-containing protein [Phlegmacium glaucopus]
MANSAGPSMKRPLSASGPETSHKIQKIHPFFGKPQDQKQDTAFQWLKPLGTTGTCLHGINLEPKATTKVAALDLDGTVIKSDVSASGKPTFEWWRSSVPDKLRELHQSGYSLLIISNQGIKPAALKVWKEKIPLIGEALNDVPFRLLAATRKDQYRKPMPGMWNEIEKIFLEEGVQIDKAESFFVGDAAGRQFTKAKADFASTDRKWAQNIGLTFWTPEEIFLKLPRHENYTMPGFQVSSLPDLPLLTPTSSPIIPTPQKQEVVLFVGYPCLGKSTFFKRYFQSEGYLHINQDTLKSRDKCVKAVKNALESGQSCVIDNTNRDAATRKAYLDLCRAHNVPSRSFIFTGSIELAWHNNLYRTFNLPPSVAANEPERTLLPYSAFTGFRDAYKEPEMTEGFSEIKKVNWVFTGTEEEKRYWSMWLQIDGK